MKKVIIVLFFLTLILMCNNNQEEIAIPKNSIRFRIIANSDSFKDQTKKIAIKEQIETEVFKNLPQTTNITTYRENLKNKIPQIEEILKNSNVEYQINYGNNYFPIKEFKGVTYNAGIYESLVITLGSGQGQNWWCVLFPPLCMMDSDENNLTDVEYKSFVQEVLEKYI